MTIQLFEWQKEVVLHFDGGVTHPATDWVKLPIVLNGVKKRLKNVHVPHKYWALRDVLNRYRNRRRIIVFIHDTIELTDLSGRSTSEQLRMILDTIVQYPQAQVVLWDSLSEKEAGWIRPVCLSILGKDRVLTGAELQIRRENEATYSRGRFSWPFRRLFWAAKTTPFVN